MIPDWLILRISLGEIVIGGATLALAFVAAFQEWIRYLLTQNQIPLIPTTSGSGLRTVATTERSPCKSLLKSYQDYK